MANKDTFCSLPFVGMNVHLNGGLAVCCMQDHNNVTHHFNQYPDWRDQGLINLKNDLISGIKNSRCNRCWELEDQGVVSYRQRWNNVYAGHPSFDLQPGGDIELYDLKFLHLDFDNFCNLRCIMCHPSVSSSIAAEYLSNKDQFLPFYGQMTINQSKWHESLEFENFLTKISNIETLILTGGEPLINPTVIRLLQSLNLNKINLIITTNATVVKPEVFELLNSARTTAITVSLEGIGDHNNYLRHGSSWKDIDSNINQLVKLTSNRLIPITINHVLQHTSIHTLPKVIEYAIVNQHEININKLNFPPWLSINGVNETNKQELVNNITDQLILADRARFPSSVKSWINSAINEIKNSTYDADIEQQFWQYIKTIDSVRGTNYQKTFLLVDKV